MDEAIGKIINKNPWLPPEPIPDDSFLFRLVPVRQTDKIGKTRFPKESHFVLREGEEGLSINWDKYIDHAGTLILQGLRFSYGTENYIDPTAYLVYKLSAKFLKENKSEKNLKHDPEYHGNPSPIGKPNNRSHSLFCYTNDDLALRVILSDYCQGNDSRCYLKNFKEINAELEGLKQRLNDTPYHKDWA